MRMLRAQSGPFLDRPYYEDQEIETIVTEELHRVDLLPTAPKPIRVDRFIEKRFGIVPQYDNLSVGTLGFTRFGAKGPEEVVVSRALSEEGSRVAERPRALSSSVALLPTKRRKLWLRAHAAERRLNSTCPRSWAPMAISSPLSAGLSRAHCSRMALTKIGRPFSAERAPSGPRPSRRAPAATMDDGGSTRRTRSLVLYFCHVSW